jgi:hypothetical protein
VIKRAGTVEFSDHTKQAWTASDALVNFRLNLSRITGYELAAVLSLYRSSQGRKDQSWDLTIEGTTYSNMSFDTDELEVQDEGMTYSLEIPVVQTQA